MKRPKKPNPSPAPSSDAWIPKSWTFESHSVANRFDTHVREQLPWYDHVIEAIAHLGAHYIPQDGIVYDIGAATGNVGLALENTLRARHASYIPLEPSYQMRSKLPLRLVGPKGIISANVQASLNQIEPFDFAVCNLVLMFVPVADRANVVRELIRRVRPGGAIVFVEKVLASPGYLGTVMRRMTIRWKLKTTSLEEIVAKELSLAGVQRPINPAIIPVDATRFFQFGEFVGWVWERSEDGRVAYENAEPAAQTETMRDELTRLAAEVAEKERQNRRRIGR